MEKILCVILAFIKCVTVVENKYRLFVCIPTQSDKLILVGNDTNFLCQHGDRKRGAYRQIDRRVRERSVIERVVVNVIFKCKSECVRKINFYIRLDS